MSRMFPVTENLIPSGRIAGERGRFTDEQFDNETTDSQVFLITSNSSMTFFGSSCSR